MLQPKKQHENKKDSIYSICEYWHITNMQSFFLSDKTWILYFLLYKTDSNFGNIPIPLHLSICLHVSSDQLSGNSNNLLCNIHGNSCKINQPRIWAAVCFCLQSCRLMTLGNHCTLSTKSMTIILKKKLKKIPQTRFQAVLTKFGSYIKMHLFGIGIKYSIVVLLKNHASAFQRVFAS